MKSGYTCPFYVRYDIGPFNRDGRPPLTSLFWIDHKRSSIDEQVLHKEFSALRYKRVLPEGDAIHRVDQFYFFRWAQRLACSMESDPSKIKWRLRGLPSPTRGPLTLPSGMVVEADDSPENREELLSVLECVRPDGQQAIFEFEERVRMLITMPFHDDLSTFAVPLRPCSGYVGLLSVLVQTNFDPLRPDPDDRTVVVDPINLCFGDDPRLSSLKSDIKGFYSPLMGCKCPVFSCTRTATPEERATFLEMNKEPLALIKEEIIRAIRSDELQKFPNLQATVRCTVPELNESRLKLPTSGCFPGCEVSAGSVGFRIEGTAFFVTAGHCAPYKKWKGFYSTNPPRVHQPGECTTVKNITLHKGIESAKKEVPADDQYRCQVDELAKFCQMMSSERDIGTWVYIGCSEDESDSRDVAVFRSEIHNIETPDLHRRLSGADMEQASGEVFRKTRDSELAVWIGGLTELPAPPCLSQTFTLPNYDEAAILVMIGSTSGVQFGWFSGVDHFAPTKDSPIPGVLPVSNRRCQVDKLWGRQQQFAWCGDSGAAVWKIMKDSAGEYTLHPFGILVNVETTGREVSYVSTLHHLRAVLNHHDFPKP